MERHKHLDYCVVDGVLMHQLSGLFRRVCGTYYVCSQGCFDKWNALSKVERESLINAERERIEESL